jgi:hypothetical protein
VVPNERKLKTQKLALRMVDASARPPRGPVPSRPTMPVSTRV